MYYFTTNPDKDFVEIRGGNEDWVSSPIVIGGD
jgi:hypothetical protein